MGKCEVLCYTREAGEDSVYAAKLADSVHLSVTLDGKEWKVLNHNGGIVYVKATQNADGTLNAMSLKAPWLFEMSDGTYGIVAVRMNADGTEDPSSRGQILLFRSMDLIHFEESPLIALPEEKQIEDVFCEYQREKGCYRLCWRNEAGECHEIKIAQLAQNPAGKMETENLAVTVTERSNLAKWPDIFCQDEWMEQASRQLEGAKIRNRIEVSREVAERMCRKLIVPVNTANIAPKHITVNTREEAEQIKARAVYSDGSSVEKPVDWDLSAVDFNKEGIYHVKGQMRQQHFSFPMAVDRADPCVTRWNGKYYFIATNDADQNHTLYIREADSLAGLVDAPEVLLLDSKTYDHVKGLLWAPEFHEIKGKLYIFHAATPGPFEKEQSHVMCLREGGDPMNREDWSEPRRVERKDGSMLYGEMGITLDMTEFEVDGSYYVCWSQRQFSPVDQGAWLYIAKIDPDQPWKLINDPVLLSMPEFGWANNHTFVDEGPFALITEKKIFLTFSSAAVDSTYMVGLLSADPGADLMDPASWTKCNYPLMSCRGVKDEYGTGHNAYVIDEDGLIWNTYHARPGVDGPRCSGFRRVHMDVEGYPVLEMTEEMDLDPNLADVETEIEVVTKQAAR